MCGGMRVDVWRNESGCVEVLGWMCGGMRLNLWRVEGRCVEV